MGLPFLPLCGSLGWRDRNTSRTYSKIGLLDRLSQHRIIDDSRPLPGTGDLWRYGAGCTGKLESVAGALQHISRVLPRFVTLSNWAVCEFDVNLEPDCGRKIFSKMSSGDELRDWKRADAKIDNLTSPGQVA
jgi:hypothetical protein